MPRTKLLGTKIEVLSPPVTRDLSLLCIGAGVNVIVSPAVRNAEGSREIRMPINRSGYLNPVQ